MQPNMYHSERTTAAELWRRVGRWWGRNDGKDDFGDKRGCGRAQKKLKEVAELLARWSDELWRDDGVFRRRRNWEKKKNDSGDDLFIERGGR